MVIRCSQCGAKIKRKDEGRFFSCPFCKSSLVLEGERTFGCFIMEHERNDLWAKALFLERLSTAGIGKATGPITVELAYVPFWVIRREDGTVTARPAAAAHLGLSSIRVPPGRLVFFEEDSRPSAPVVAPSVPLGEALGTEDDTRIARIDLVYLPVYSVRSDDAAGEHSLSLVADSSRLYSGTLRAQEHNISLRPLLFFAGTAGLFVATGVLVGDVYMRAAAIAAGALICLVVSPLAIGRIR